VTRLIYNHGKWHYELIEALGCWRTLGWYCANTDAIHAHLKTAGAPQRSTESGKLVDVPKREIKKWIDGVSESINIAFDAYSRQLVVVVASVIEAALAEVFAVLFTARPESMHRLESELAQAGVRLSTSLEELSAAQSIDELRATVVDRAVSVAVQGKPRTLLKRIERLFGCSIDSPLLSAYVELIDARNRIVHEHSRSPVSTEEVERFFDTGTQFVEFLGKAATAAKVPVDDPMMLFGEYVAITPDEFDEIPFDT